MKLRCRCSGMREDSRTWRGNEDVSECWMLLEHPRYHGPCWSAQLCMNRDYARYSANISRTQSCWQRSTRITTVFYGGQVADVTWEAESRQCLTWEFKRLVFRCSYADWCLHTIVGKGNTERGNLHESPWRNPVRCQVYYYHRIRGWGLGSKKRYNGIVLLLSLWSTNVYRFLRPSRKSWCKISQNRSIIHSSIHIQLAPAQSGLQATFLLKASCRGGLRLV
jgi:hypothetical protein